MKTCSVKSARIALLHPSEQLLEIDSVGSQSVGTEPFACFAVVKIRVDSGASYFHKTSLSPSCCTASIAEGRRRGEKAPIDNRQLSGGLSVRILIPQVNRYASIGLIKMLRNVRELDIEIFGCDPIRFGEAAGTLLVDRSIPSSGGGGYPYRMARRRLLESRHRSRYSLHGERDLGSYQL